MRAACNKDNPDIKTIAKTLAVKLITGITREKCLRTFRTASPFPQFLL